MILKAGVQGFPVVLEYQGCPEGQIRVQEEDQIRVPKEVQTGVLEEDRIKALDVLQLKNLMEVLEFREKDLVNILDLEEGRGRVLVRNSLLLSNLLFL